MDPINLLVTLLVIVVVLAVVYMIMRMVSLPPEARNIVWLVAVLLVVVWLLRQVGAW